MSVTSVIGRSVSDANGSTISRTRMKFSPLSASNALACMSARNRARKAVRGRKNAKRSMIGLITGRTAKGYSRKRGRNAKKRLILLNKRVLC